jgi:hypothetical protein
VGTASLRTWGWRRASFHASWPESGHADLVSTATYFQSSRCQAVSMSCRTAVFPGRKSGRELRIFRRREFSVGASGDPVRPTYGLAWSQSLAQSENLLPEPELPLIHLDSPFNREGQLARPASPPAFPLRSRTADEHVPLMKRAMDITGSLIALVLFSSLLLVIALTIKLTSFLGRRGSDNMANSLSFPPVTFLNRPRMNL